MEKPKLNLEPLIETARVGREDFELACIREFSHSGHQLGVGVSRGERRERIRTAILREQKAHMRWHDSGLNYADVFAQVFKQPLAAGDIHEENSARRGTPCLPA